MSTLFTRWRGGASFVSLILAAGCVSTPRPGDPGAAGTITMPMPVFTPITALDSYQALDFGKHKDVDALWDDLSSPNVVRSSVDVHQTTIAAKLQLALPSINSTRTTTLKDDGTTTTTGTDSTTEKTPDVPTPPAPTASSAEVQKAMAAILIANELKPKLTPEEIGTLVADYRNYLIALEQFDRPPLPDDTGTFYPYRVTFKVVVEPGWYTQMRDYEATAKVSLGENIEVLNVMPTETAQVIEDFTASLQGLALALELAGGGGPAAADAKFENVRQHAERLQGLRTKTNVIVSYPGPDQFKVRFRPRLSAEEGNSLDLQPTSRLFTAVVRVKHPPIRLASGTVDDKGVFHNATSRRDIPIVDAFNQSLTFEPEFVPSTTDRKHGGMTLVADTKSPIKLPVRSFDVTVPAYKSANREMVISLLDGDLQKVDGGQVVNIAYGLQSPYTLSALTVSIAGADPVWNADTGAKADPIVWQKTFKTDTHTPEYKQDPSLSRGVFRVKLATTQPVEAVKLPVQFAAWGVDEQNQAIMVSKIAILSIGGPAKPKTPDAPSEKKIDVSISGPAKLGNVGVQVSPADPVVPAPPASEKPK